MEGGSRSGKTEHELNFGPAPWAGRAAMRIERLQGALLFGLLVHSASAAVHSYNQELFYSVADAFMYRGGRQDATWLVFLAG